MAAELTYPGLSAPQVSLRVVYTSLLPGITADALIAAGSTTFGTDQYARLQAALAGGNVEMIVDGQYSLSGILKLSSNTRLRFLPGCGFIMRPGSNCSMFANATQITNPTACSPTASDGLGHGGFLVSNTQEQNITLEGGYFNLNSTGGAVTNGDHKTGPDNLWIFGARFLGVGNLQIKGCIFYDAPAYSVAVCNIDGAEITDTSVLQPLTGSNGAPVPKNTDGLHFNGPCRNLFIARCTLSTGDDSIGLNADDGYQTGTGDPNGPHVAYPGWAWGQISDVDIEDVVFLKSLSGIRLLSTYSRVDRIRIRRLSGSVVDMMVQLGDEFYPGNGNFGRVEVDGLDIDRMGTSTPQHPTPIFCNTTIDSLSLRNVRVYNTASTEPIFSLGVVTSGKTNGVGDLALEGWEIFNPTGTQNTTAWIQFNSGVGTVRASGMTLKDAAGNTGALFGGAVVPTAMTISNYAGPAARLLASGFNPAVKNGDAFTNS